MKFKTKVKKLIAKLKKKLPKKIEVSNNIKMSLLALSVGAFAYLASDGFKHNDVIQSTVKITNLEGNSGGSGVILRSSDSGSEILTNAHVCGVVESGGLIETKNGSYMVTAYKKSNKHDLCMIKVSSNLKINTKVSDHSPIAYYEKALISGHPKLLPNVVTSGHFSNNKVISVLTGTEPCSPEEMRTNIVCMFFGIKPIISLYEATLVTATIMAGSSGSGVFNEDLELSALAFAGSGELSYAWTVPYEYVKDFINVESYKLPYNNLGHLSLKSSSSGKTKQLYWGLVEKCKQSKSFKQVELVETICKVIENDVIWRN